MLKGIRIASLISFITLIYIPHTSYAAMPLPFGWYVEGNLGESRASGKSFPQPSHVTWTGFGGNFNLGYKFNPFFSTEIGATGYANTRIKNSAGATAAKDSHFSVDLAGKVMLPVGDTGFELFGKLGAANLNSDVTVYPAASLDSLSFDKGNHSTTNIYFGAGADFAITPNLAANFQWQQANGGSSTGNLALYSLGLSWLF